MPFFGRRSRFPGHRSLGNGQEGSIGGSIGSKIANFRPNWTRIAFELRIGGVGLAIGGGSGAIGDQEALFQSILNIGTTFLMTPR